MIDKARLFKIIAVIADIHIGKKNIKPKNIKKQLTKYFVGPLRNMKYLDAILILGDIMDSATSMNSEYAEVFSWFISEVYHIAKKKKCSVFILKGTTSHDGDQLNNIKHYQLNDDGVDFRVFDTIQKTDLFNDYKVLILPDVKIEKDEDVEQFFDDKYDLILGHGTIDSMKFFTQESENAPTKSYNYELDKLIKICNGPIFFGHIHPHFVFKNKFYYVGSFPKLERGSEGKNGFLICGIYDKDRTKFKVEQFVNEESPDYYEVKLDRHSIEENSIDDIIEYIDIMIDCSRENDLIAIKIERSDDITSSDKVLIIEERYRNDPRISITKKVKTDKTEKMAQMNEQKKQRYSYLMDQNMSVEEIMFKYYKEDIEPVNDIYSKVYINIDEFKRVLRN